MRKDLLGKLQEKVDESLVRNANLLDVMSKITDSASRTNRAVTRAITSCGCISVEKQKNEENENAGKDHLSGELCSICREKVEEEIGKTHYYISALCGTLNLSESQIVEREIDRIDALGKFLLR